MRKRGFEVVKEYENKDINLPVRKTKYSAAYDVEAAEEIVIKPFALGTKPVLVPTGIKAYCQTDEFYMLFNRSSGPLKKGLVLANSVGVIDADYYGNEENDGHIFFAFYNFQDKDVIIHKGDAIGQIVFQKYLLVDDDSATGIRTGGFGSTDRKQ